MGDTTFCPMSYAKILPSQERPRTSESQEVNAWESARTFPWQKEKVRIDLFSPLKTL